MAREEAGGGKVLFGRSVAEGYRQHLEPVIFQPWAERLVDFVGVDEGQTVLDVAAGTGVVTRAAARRVGAGGRVIASDISGAVLGHVRAGFPDGGPSLEVLECPATALQVADGSVDVALCQQGLPFISDRPAAMAEMRRVLRPGGKAGVAVWLSDPRIEPFIVYGDALREQGVPEPFNNAYDSTALTMPVQEVRGLLEASGLRRVEVTVRRLELGWPSARAAADAVAGTPYGPVVAGLGSEVRERVMDDILRRMTAPDGSPVRHLTVSVLARGIAP